MRPKVGRKKQKPILPPAMTCPKCQAREMFPEDDPAKPSPEAQAVKEGPATLAPEDQDGKEGPAKPDSESQAEMVSPESRGGKGRPESLGEKGASPKPDSESQAEKVSPESRAEKVSPESRGAKGASPKPGPEVQAGKPGPESKGEKGGAETQGEKGASPKPGPETKGEKGGAESLGEMGASPKPGPEVRAEKPGPESRGEKPCPVSREENASPEKRGERGGPGEGLGPLSVGRRCRAGTPPWPPRQGPPGGEDPHGRVPPGGERPPDRVAGPRAAHGRTPGSHALLRRPRDLALALRAGRQGPVRRGQGRIKARAGPPRGRPSPPRPGHPGPGTRRPRYLSDALAFCRRSSKGSGTENPPVRRRGWRRGRPGSCSTMKARTLPRPRGPVPRCAPPGARGRHGRGARAPPECPGREEAPAGPHGQGDARVPDGDKARRGGRGTVASAHLRPRNAAFGTRAPPSRQNAFGTG
jgi:hypothetical protein